MKTKRMKPEFLKRPVILNAFLRNCKQSDREIATISKVSQPTITRVRQRLERTGIIKHYMAIPDYNKIGYPFGSVITGQSFSEGSLKELISKSDIVLKAPCIELNQNIILITMHKTIEDYKEFLKKVKTVISDATISLFTTEGLEVKPLQILKPLQIR